MLRADTDPGLHCTWALSRALLGHPTNHHGRDADHGFVEDPGVRHRLMGLLDGVSSMRSGPRWRLVARVQGAVKVFVHISHMLSFMLAGEIQFPPHTRSLNQLVLA